MWYIISEAGIFLNVPEGKLKEKSRPIGTVCYLGTMNGHSIIHLTET